MILSGFKKFLKGDDADLYWRFRVKFIERGGVINYLLLKRIEKRNNSEIGLRYDRMCASFESAPQFPHGLNGIIISNKAKIGKNAIILHQVTIGTAMVKEKTRDELGAPIIGDNVYIGAGAKIIGEITIGDNCIIGANAVVTKNIPDNCTAVGVPAVIRKNSGKYIDKEF